MRKSPERTLERRSFKHSCDSYSSLRLALFLQPESTVGLYNPYKSFCGEAPQPIPTGQNAAKLTVEQFKARSGTETSSVLKTIVVALDASELSDQVVGTLQELQLQSTTKVILAHVISSPESNAEWSADRPHVNSEEIPYRHVEKQLQAYQAHLPCSSELEIVTGDPAEEVVRLAHIHDADLIVIGSRGLTGLKRILLGSVSSQVVADAHCSVLVVRPK